MRRYLVMKRHSYLLILILAAQSWAADQAKNVILFLGDAGGIPTLNAGSIQAYGDATKLYLQHMPHLALSETSSATDWITDSAAGMTAIVTGTKTKNGVLSQMPPKGGEEGAALKTILEYAEEHGLSTGVISNSPMYDATPAACYAHVSSRKKTGEIFAQVWQPRFGDGVDIVFGPGRKAVTESTQQMGIDLAGDLRKHGYWFSDNMGGIPPGTARAVVLTDDADFDIAGATRTAIAILSRNPKGFFLMVESDLHTDKLQQGLERVPKFDRLIEETVKAVAKNTLVLFTADHSFDLRTVASLAKGQPLFTVDGAGKVIPAKGVVVNGHHSGEQVLVAADGPGAGRVRGFIANTDLFGIMLAAWGWRADASTR
jgi:alkaline phosphatase